MSDTENRLARDRASRTTARGLFDHRLAQVKADLSARGVGGRIKDKAVRQSEDVLAQGLEIARENRGVVAATGAALALWFFRKPLAGLVNRIAQRRQDAIQDAGDNAAHDLVE